MNLTKTHMAIIKMLGLLPDNHFLNVFQISTCLYFLQSAGEIEGCEFIKVTAGIVFPDISELVNPLESNGFIKKVKNPIHSSENFELDLKGAKLYPKIKEFDFTLMAYLPNIINKRLLELIILEHLRLKIGMSSDEYRKIPSGGIVVCPKEFIFKYDPNFDIDDSKEYF